jgi:tight adherence protein B
MILFAAFVAILMTTFGIMALVMKSSKQQRAVERRMATIQSHGEASTGGPQITELLLKAEPQSSFGWLENLLQRYQIVHMLETRIAQADSKMSVVRLLLSSATFAGAGFVGAYFFVPFVAIQLAAACAAGFVPFGIISFKRSRRIAAFNAALPDAIDMMGRALRAGHSMVASINVVAEQSVEPVCSEFSEVFKQQNFGLPLRDALNQMLDHVPSQDLRVLVTGILVQKETGGNLAEILDRTANVIRERLRIQGEIKTHTAQGRMTGWILCTLPVVMLLVINMINPGYSRVLMDTEMGHKLIYAGLFLLTIGAFIIRQIINKIEV